MYAGSAGTGTGGNYRNIDDGGTVRWLTGILGSVGARNWSLFDVVNNAERMNIDATTGAATFGGEVVVPNGTTATGPTGFAGTLAAVYDFAGDADFSPGARIISYGNGSVYKPISLVQVGPSARVPFVVDGNGVAVLTGSTAPGTAGANEVRIGAGQINAAGAVTAGGKVQSLASAFSGSNAGVTLTTQNTWYSLGFSGYPTGIFILRNATDAGVGVYWGDSGVSTSGTILALTGIEFRISSGVPQARCTTANGKVVEVVGLFADIS